LPALRQAIEGSARSSWFVSTTACNRSRPQLAHNHELGGDDKQAHCVTQISAADRGCTSPVRCRALRHAGGWLRSRKGASSKIDQLMKDLGYILSERVKLSRGQRRIRRKTVESQAAINVNELHRAKAFRDHWVSFPNYGFICPSVSWVRACRWRIEIYSYSATRDGRPQTVPIVWIFCRIGDRTGYRPWFQCICGRRAGKLYNAGPVFACRKCCNLIYECQLKSAKGRLHRTATKIRHQLSCAERRLAFKDKIPPRPWGMRTARYRRLIFRMLAVDAKIAHWEQKRQLRRHRCKRG